MKGLLLLNLVRFWFDGHNKGITGTRKGRLDGDKQRNHWKRTHQIHNRSNVNKNPTDTTVCRRLFTAKLLYMFRVSQHPSSGVLNTVESTRTNQSRSDHVGGE